MATTQKLVSKKFNVDNAGNFVHTVEVNSAAYYLFTAKHTAYTPNDAIIETPSDSVSKSTIDIYNDMLFGKKITLADVKRMVPRHNWETGVVYAMYDHDDGDLFSKNFYCSVNAGAQYHVYKCLDNAQGASSTVEPTGTDITPIYSPVDGYVWKYMYTTDSSTFNKFQTANTVPVTPNTAVITGATAGTIEVIKVVDGGLGYNNYFTSTFRLSDIRVGGQEIIYGLQEDASDFDNYYQGCVIKITSGAAADDYRIITDYQVSGGQKKIYLNEPFSNVPSPTDSYEIYPFVYIFGDGNQTANCMARAIVSPTTGNSISRVEILTPGSGYRSAVGIVDIMEIVGASANCVLRPIISPPGGHGADPYYELGANKVGISIKYANTENGYIPAVNDYRTVGIIRDPLFQNVNIQYKISDTLGTFFAGEDVYQYRDVVLSGAVTTSANVATVTGTGTYFDTSLRVGDWVHITDGNQNFFSQVLNVVSNTTFNCTTNVPVGFTDAKVSYTHAVSQGTIVATAVGELTLSQVEVKNRLDSNSYFGALSYATTVIDQSNPIPVSINNELLNGEYNTFVQLNKFIGEVTSSNTAFIQDERVSQENLVIYNQPTASFHSFIEGGTTDTMFVSNVNNVFMTNRDILGETSGTVLNLTNKYPGHLVHDSGKILYIENVDPISRQSNRSETIKIILEF